MDRLLCPTGGDSYNQVAQEQQHMANILQIFDQDLNIHVAALPTSNRGLTTEHIRKWILALEAFHWVLRC